MLYKAFPTHFSGSMLHKAYGCHSPVSEIDICAHPWAILKSSRYLLRGSSRLTSAAFKAKQNKPSLRTTSRKTTQEGPENWTSRKTTQEEPEKQIETRTTQSTASEEGEGHERTDSQLCTARSNFLKSKIGNVAHRKCADNWWCDEACFEVWTWDCKWAKGRRQFKPRVLLGLKMFSTFWSSQRPVHDPYFEVDWILTVTRANTPGTQPHVWKGSDLADICSENGRP